MGALDFGIKTEQLIFVLYQNSFINSLYPMLF